MFSVAGLVAEAKIAGYRTSYVALTSPLRIASGGRPGESVARCLHEYDGGPSLSR